MTDTITALQNSGVIGINNIGTSPVSIISASPTRKKLTFHAPGANDIIVFPTTVLAGTPGGGSITLAPSLAALGGGFRIFANGGLTTIEGRIARQAWQALSVAGANQPLTVTEE
jgi:hypothetical protein